MEWALLMLKNKWVRYGLIAVLVLAAFVVAKQHYINVGKEDGRQEEKQNTKAEVQRVQEQDRNQTVAAVAQIQAVAAANGARADSAEAVAAQFADLNRTLISQRNAVAAKVNAVPDSELHGHITDTLALRPPSDATVGYYPVEERAIYSTLLERPLLQKQADTNAAEIAKHTEAINELRSQVANQQKAYEALAGYTGRLETRYTEIYNLYPKKERGVKCVYMWSCKKKVIPVPNPDDLKKELVNGSANSAHQ